MMPPMQRANVVALSVAFTALAWPTEATAAEVPVSTTAELSAAITNASPGDEIILAPGDYLLTSKASCTANGTAEQPIIVRGDALGEATVQFDTVEGFHVQGAHWQFERLEIDNSPPEGSFGWTQRGDIVRLSRAPPTIHSLRPRQAPSPI
jgi:hypothetical protein